MFKGQVQKKRVRVSLDRTQGQKNAITEVANNIGISLSASTAPLSKASPQSPSFDTSAEIGKAVSSGEQAEKKLGQVGDIRQALAAHLPDGVGGEQRKAELESANLSPEKNLAMRGAVYAGMTALGLAVPAVGAGMAVAEAVRFAMAPAPGVPEHAGLQHAVLNPGKTEFKPVSSSSGKGKKDPILSDYTDSQGDQYVNGFAASGKPSSKPQAPVPRPQDLQIHASAGSVVDELGHKKVADDLAGVSEMEKRLGQQAAAAEDQLERLGVRPENKIAPPASHLARSGPSPAPG